MSKTTNLFYFVLNLFVWLLALNVLALAYVPSDDYHGVKVKFYANISKDYCYNQFDKINLSYFKGLRQISVYNKEFLVRDEIVRGYFNACAFGFPYFGYFWIFEKNIELFDNCKLTTIQHELAHHCQTYREPKNKMVKNIQQHKGEFDKCLAEIKSYTK